MKHCVFNFHTKIWLIFISLLPSLLCFEHIYLHNALTSCFYFMLKTLKNSSSDPHPFIPMAHEDYDLDK